MGILNYLYFGTFYFSVLYFYPKKFFSPFFFLGWLATLFIMFQKILKIMNLDYKKIGEKKKFKMKKKK